MRNDLIKTPGRKRKGEEDSLVDLISTPDSSASKVVDLNELGDACRKKSQPLKTPKSTKSQCSFFTSNIAKAHSEAVSEYFKDRCNKKDSTYSRWDGEKVCDILQRANDYLPARWKKEFETHIRRTYVSPLYVARILDPIKQMYEGAYTVMEAHGQTCDAQSALCFREGECVKDNVVTLYMHYLNNKAFLSDMSIAFLGVLQGNYLIDPGVGPHTDPAKIKLCLPVYGVRGTLVELLNRFHTVVLPVCRDTHHWIVYAITKSSSEKDDFNVHYYCSLNSIDVPEATRAIEQALRPGKTSILAKPCPKQDDSNSCGFFMMRNCEELLFNGGPPREGFSYTLNTEEYRITILHRLLGNSVT